MVTRWDALGQGLVPSSNRTFVIFGPLIMAAVALVAALQPVMGSLLMTAVDAQELCHGDRFQGSRFHHLRMRASRDWRGAACLMSSGG